MTVRPPVRPNAARAYASWEVEPRGGLLPTFSPELGERLGFEPAEWAEAGFAVSRVHPEDRERVRLFWQCLADAPYSEIEYRMLRKHGDPVWLRDSVTVWQEGERVRARGVTVDVHDAKQEHVELRHRVALYAGALEAISDGILVLDRLGNIVVTNKKLVEMWRMPPELVVPGRSDALLSFVLKSLADPASFVPHVNRTSSDPDSPTGDEIVLADGRLFERQARPHVVEGNAVGLVITCRDVTLLRYAEARYHDLLVLEQAARLAAEEAQCAAQILAGDVRHSLDELQKAQEQLVKRERLAALGELASTIAHEVRNALGAIYNSVASLRRRVAVEGEVGVLLDIVSDEANRLNRLVLDLLVFAEPIRGRPLYQPALGLVEGAVESAVRLVDTSGSVRIEKRFAEDLPEVFVDHGLAALALTNVVVNALQAMPAGGELTLTAEQRVVGDRTFVALRVRDTGGGLSPEVAARVFEPFYTTKALGTGLGLSITKRLLEEQNGEIHVEPQPEGSGAAFLILLPC